MKWSNTYIKTWIIVVMCIIVCHPFAKAQNQFSAFTQSFDNLTPVNPAYSVMDKSGSVNTTVRKKWIGVQGSPMSSLFNVNLPIDDMDAATGFIVHSDELAIERQLKADVFFAKSIELNDTDYGDICYLSVSLNAGVKNYVANYSGLDSVDPVFGSNIHQTKPNVGFGIMWYTDWYYLGLSAPQLDFTSLGTASVQSNSSFVNHYYFSGAFITNLADDIKIRPALQVAYAKGSPVVSSLSAMVFMQETVGLGLSCQFKNDMAAIITVTLDKIHLGYNYQFATSANNIGGFNSATHEVSFCYRFGDTSKRKLL